MTGRLDRRPVVPVTGKLRPLGIKEVQITGGFWSERQEVNESATIGHCHDWMERSGGSEIPLRLLPYHQWANRGPSTMRVWIPTV
jgi:DUF1680 family protein